MNVERTKEPTHEEKMEQNYEALLRAWGKISDSLERLATVAEKFYDKRFPEIRV